MQLFEETEMECDVRNAQKMDMRNFLTCIDELEYYSLLQVDRSGKKDHKLFIVNLNCDIAELERELNNLVPKEEDV